jgi:hypothetical protein
MSTCRSIHPNTIHRFAENKRVDFEPGRVIPILKQTPKTQIGA